MVEADTVQTCNVCGKPVDGRALDVQLGPVCLRCKSRLRWAHFWLTKDDTGIRECTNKYNYRMNEKGT
jgi:hypothetical protein